MASSSASHSGTNSPLVSIIIPCFNDGRFLAEAVQSAETSTRVPQEIIVVNDGSTDPSTLELLGRLEKRGLTVLHQENKGLGTARNRGIAQARGAYILPLDADNRVRPSYASRAVEILEREPKCEVVYGDRELFGERQGYDAVPEFDLKRLLAWNFIDACAVYRKAAWARCGGYDEQMPVNGYEDWDLWCRIACSGGGFHHVLEALYDYRMRGDSMSVGMSQADKVQATLRHMHAKKIEVRLGDFVEAYHSADSVVEGLRKAPVRTLFRLFRQAYFSRRARPSHG